MKHHIYDIAASLVLDEATARFSPKYRVSIERLDNFRKFCDALCSGTLLERLRSTGYTVTVNEQTRDLVVTLYMKKLDFGTMVFSDLVSTIMQAQSAWTMVFRAEDNTLAVDITMDGIWEEI